MEPHRVRRLAEVLVASQLRSGRANSDPKSFFGRGYSILLFDAIGFVVAFVGAYALFSAIGSVDPSLAGLELIGVNGMSTAEFLSPPWTESPARRSRGAPPVSRTIRTSSCGSPTWPAGLKAAVNSNSAIPPAPKRAAISNPSP